VANERVDQEVLAEYLLCRLVRDAGEVKGRVRMQKAVYLTGLRLGPLFDDYFFHLRGPYSPALSRSLRTLVAAGLIREREEPLSPQGGMIGYCYRPTPDGEQALKDFESLPTTRELVQRGAEYSEIFTNLVKREVRVLELAASILYWMRKGHDEEEAKRITIGLKACQPQELPFQKAVRLVDELGPAG